MMLTKAGAVLYFEKKNITKSQYEGIREIFEKNNILCKMKKINFKRKIRFKTVEKINSFSFRRQKYYIYVMVIIVLIMLNLKHTSYDEN